MSTIPVSLIVAVARNGVIGANGGLPWRSSADMAHFKRTTLGHAVVMGRKTWQSLPNRPLPGRQNIVVSRDSGLDAAGSIVCASPEDALGAARRWSEDNGADEIFVIGGASLFARALPVAQRIHMTEVDCSPEGDVFFPRLEQGVWQDAERPRILAGREDQPPVTIRNLVKGTGQ